MANGFANRFLILQVKRARLLPNGGTLEKVDLSLEIKKLNAAISFSQKPHIFERSPECSKLWENNYPQLSREREGMLGAILSRAEAQVLRLSCIYALLDCSNIIEIQHLNAALAFWAYVEQSCENIFQNNSGNKQHNKLLKALQDSPAGLTRSDIVKRVFSGNSRKHVIDSYQSIFINKHHMKVEYKDGVEIWRLF